MIAGDDDVIVQGWMHKMLLEVKMERGAWLHILGDKIYDRKNKCPSHAP